MRMVSKFAILENRHDETTRMVLQYSVAEHRHAATMRKGRQPSILESRYDETMRMVSQSSVPEWRISRFLPFIHSHTCVQDSIASRPSCEGIYLNLFANMSFASAPTSHSSLVGDCLGAVYTHR